MKVADLVTSSVDFGRYRPPSSSAEPHCLAQSRIPQQAGSVHAKHHAPINPSLYGIVNPEIIAKLAGVPVAWQTSDDIALIFLNNSADTATAAASLQAGAQKGRIREVIWGKELIDRGFGDPATDSAVPDIIVAPDVGIIYTASRVNDKVEEHGGLSRDDRLVACFVSNPRLKKRIFNERVYTTQVGPTILTALGISPELLQGAVEEGTEVLPGFTSTPSAA